MNLEKFTQKSIAALQEAKAQAEKYSNSQIEAAHLLFALLSDRDGLIPELLLSMSVDVSGLISDTEGLVSALPRLSLSCPRSKR